MLTLFVGVWLGQTIQQPSPASENLTNAAESDSIVPEPASHQAGDSPASAAKAEAPAFEASEPKAVAPAPTPASNEAVPQPQVAERSDDSDVPPDESEPSRLDTRATHKTAENTRAPADTRAPIAPPASRERPSRATTTERNAWLDVTVTPRDRTWQVWVDGQYFGPADVKIKVTPGRHVVEVGAEKPTVKRVVRAVAQRHRAVPFEL